jgi:hypothetical protein
MNVVASIQPSRQRALSRQSSSAFRGQWSSTDLQRVGSAACCTSHGVDGYYRIRAIASARTSCFSAPVSLADGRSLLLLALIHKARAAGGRAESGACGVLLTFVVFAVSGNPVASESLLRCREIKPTVADQVAHELFQTVFRLSIPFRLNCLYLGTFATAAEANAAYQRAKVT